MCEKSIGGFTMLTLCPSPLEVLSAENFQQLHQ